MKKAIPTVRNGFFCEEILKFKAITLLVRSSLLPCILIFLQALVFSFCGLAVDRTVRPCGGDLFYPSPNVSWQKLCFRLSLPGIE